MITSIALLRGINVGGNNPLPMKSLVALLESLGLENVSTYIQSGNAVFQAKRKPPKTLAAKIRRAIGEAHGFEPEVLVLGADAFGAAMDENPFPKATSEPKTLHVSFLETQRKNPDLDAIKAARAKTEHYVLTERAFYLHAPDGIARSRLAARAESWLGVRATARNWRSVEAIWKLASKLEGE